MSSQGDSDRSNPDYDIILAALMESARGRAFLEEYARRSRVTETETLLTAIGRIENLLMSRSLEPAGQAGADPSAAPSRADSLDADVFEAEPPQNENSAPVTAEQASGASAQVVDIVIPSVEPAAGQPSAIEFLGPQTASIAGRDEPQSSNQRPPEATSRQSRDPFADIRALSDEEKIALFA